MPNDKKIRLKMLYDQAQKDPQYLALDEDFRAAQEAFGLFLQGLTDAEREVVELFLLRYSARSNFLLDMALHMQE